MSIQTERPKVKSLVGRANPFSYNCSLMRKDAPLAFRIPADLKRRLLKIARLEARSLSQVCEILLKIGVEEYEEGGQKYLQKALSPPRSEGQGQS